MLNPKLAPNWFTDVKVIEITPNPGISGTVPLKTQELTANYYKNYVKAFTCLRML